MSKLRGKSTTKLRDKSGKNKQEEEGLSAKTAEQIFLLLSKNDSCFLLEMTASDMESFLEGKFHLNPVTDLTDAAILDYYVGAIYWGKTQGFTPVQLCGFFYITHFLLHSIKNDRSSLVDLITEFRKMLIGIAVNVTTLSSDVKLGGYEFFSAEQAKAITDYIYISLFQNYNLYKYMFTKSQREIITKSELTVEVPFAADLPFPPPLDEAIFEDVLKDYLDIPIPTLSEVIKEDRDEDRPDMETLSPTAIELPPEAENAICKLSPEEVKAIIQEVSEEFLRNLQVGVENKLKDQENVILNKINKVHVVQKGAESMDRGK